MRTPRAKTQSDLILRKIRAQTRTAAFQKYLQNLLMELCDVDTTPKADITQMRAAEDRCFQILERELAGLRIPGARLERRPLNPAIQTHPAYSLLHFTKTPQRPAGLSPEETYAGRCNLLYSVPGQSTNPRGSSLALNAHIDVVAPYLPPRCKAGIVYGRGACDDKGPVVSFVAALRVLAEVLAHAAPTRR